MILGIDLGGTNVRAGLVDNGSILRNYQAELSEKNSLESTLQQLFHSILKMVDNNYCAISKSILFLEQQIQNNKLRQPIAQTSTLSN